jgi:hypothetical protein
VLDMSGSITPVYPGFVSATRTNKLSPFVVAAGTFADAYVYEAPDSSNIQTFVFGPNVGIVRLEGKVGTWDLQSARIGGRQYP